MAGYDLRIQQESETDKVEGMAEAYNACIPAPVTKDGNKTLVNDTEDDTIANSYQMTAIRPHGGSPYSEIKCNDSYLQGVYRETMGEGY